MCCERERGHFKPSRLRAEAHSSSPDVTGKVEPTQAGIGARVPEAITGRSCQSLLPAWNALGYRVPAAVSPLHLPPLLCGCFGDRRGLGDGGTPHSKHWDTGSAAKEKRVIARARSPPLTLTRLGGNWANTIHLQGTEVTGNMSGFAGEDD